MDFTELDDENWEIHDIEETKEFCQENQICPYYYQIDRMEYADIILAPYNYMINSRIRAMFNKVIKSGSQIILIFDEAHNIPDICEDEASFELDLKIFENWIKDIQYLISISENKNKDIDRKESTDETNLSSDKILTKQDRFQWIELWQRFIDFMKNAKPEDQIFTVIGNIQKASGEI